MNFSADVLKLNPELATPGRPVTYRVKHERVLKASDVGGAAGSLFDSQLECDFYAELLARGLIVCPHPFTLHMPGGVDYTPDFMAWFADKLWPAVYEVKGSGKAKNARDSRTRFRIAAGLYPCFTWVWVTRSPRGAWIEKFQRS